MYYNLKNHISQLKWDQFLLSSLIQAAITAPEFLLVMYQYIIEVFLSHLNLVNTA